MKPITATGKLLFKTVSQALSDLHIDYQAASDRSVLVWNDTIRDADYFTSLQPWQVVNRIPMINLICRKAPFVRTVHRIGRFFPAHYNFIPRSFILPHQNVPFAQVLNSTRRRYIIKPDCGALGNGIQIIEPGKPFTPWTRLAVAQEYIESALIDGYKFDLRVYALVASTSPLRVYVYRNGIARFCSEPAASRTIFSELTNTAVNMKNPAASAASITKTIEEVFGRLKQQGVDVEKIWKEIDRVIALTMISVSGFIAHAANTKCPSAGYPRCFQVLGFDILLDKDWKPWVLEVNYRPSLEFGTQEERQMKVEMLKDVVRIAAPLEDVEALVRAREKTWTFVMWRSHMERNRSALEKAKQKRKIALQNSKFVKVYPTKGEHAAAWKNIMNVVQQMPNEVTDSYQMPRLVDYIPPQQRTPQPMAPIKQVDLQKSRRIVTPLKKTVKVA